MKTDQIYELFLKSAGVNTDSRNITKGEIFFALWGEKYNGNEFAAEALAKGASWAVIDDPLYESEKTILVDDCLFELQALASRHRKEMNIPVIAITGTNGKTTTKELLAVILAKKFRIHATHGNLNNSIGVPLTILSAPKETELMVIEMGASHVGEIWSLCLIAKPEYGIITNIGSAHISGFGSIGGVVKAKTELYEYIRKVNGIALYNEKNPILAEHIFKIINRAVPFSDPTGIELTLEYIKSDINLVLSANYNHSNYIINTNLFGKFNIDNIKAAIATGLFFGVDMDKVVSAVENYHPENNRSQVKYTANNTLICDSYNANPVSMSMALESFVEIDTENKLVIIGDMLELGEKSDAEHIVLLNALRDYGFEKVLLVGPVFKKNSSEYHFKSFSDVDDLISFLKREPVKGNTILIKGSRGIGLEKIYNLL